MGVAILDTNVIRLLILPIVINVIPRETLLFVRSARPAADIDDDTLGTFKFFFIG